MVKRVGAGKSLFGLHVEVFFLMKIFRWKLVFESQANLFTALCNMVNELSLFSVQMNFGASFFLEVQIRVVKAWNKYDHAINAHALSFN